jgi:prepilin signal peptidase PulO-like enzyme (type II secretory pathway)
LVLDKIVLPATLILFGINLFLGQNFWNLIIAGLVGAGFFFLQFIISRGKWIGGGDIRLGALLGFFFGWPQIAMTIFLAYIIGAIVSLILVVFGKKKMTSQIPLGPFLVIGALITLFYGQQIIGWYLK